MQRKVGPDHVYGIAAQQVLKDAGFRGEPSETHRRHVLAGDSVCRSQVGQRAGLVEPKQVGAFQRGGEAGCVTRGQIAHGAQNEIAARARGGADTVQSLQCGVQQRGAVVGRMALRAWNQEGLVPGRASLSNGRHYGIVRLPFDPRQRPCLIASGPTEHLIDGCVGELADQVEHRHVQTCQGAGRRRQAAANALKAAGFSPLDCGTQAGKIGRRDAGALSVPNGP